MKKHGHQWKGNKLGYAAAHSWLRVHHTDKKKMCKQCGSKENLQFAKKHGHKYTRFIEDYRILCQSCHLKYDGQFNKPPWNKGNIAVYPKNCPNCHINFNGKKKSSIYCSCKCSSQSRPLPIRPRSTENGRWLALNKHNQK